MTMYIGLGRPKSEFPNMTPEISEAWDRLALQIKEIQESGLAVEIQSEMTDFIEPIS